MSSVLEFRVLNSLLFRLFRSTGKIDSNLPQVGEVGWSSWNVYKDKKDEQTSRIRTEVSLLSRTLWVASRLYQTTDWIDWSSLLLLLFSSSSPLLNRFTGDSDKAIKSFHRARGDPEFGLNALYHMIEICNNPDNDVIGSVVIYDTTKNVDFEKIDSYSATAFMMLNVSEPEFLSLSSITVSSIIS